jgi:O-antigen/teichoic acid export membrane protein
LGQGIQLAAWTISFPLAARALGVERVGILGLMWAFLVYASIFDLGLSRASTWALARVPATGHAERWARWAWSAICGQAVLGIAGMTVALMAVTLAEHARAVHSPSLTKEAFAAFRLVALAVPFALISNGFQGVLEARLRFGRVSIVKSVSGILNGAALVLGAIFGFGLLGFAAMITAARAATAISMGMMAVLTFPSLRRMPVLEWAIAQRLLRFGGWAMGSNWIAPVLLMGDRVIVAAFLSARDLGYYTISQEIVIRLLVLYTTIATVAYPAFSATFVQSDARAVRETWRVGLLLMGLVSFGVLAAGSVAPALLRAWLGFNSTQVAALSRVLAVGGILQGIAQLPLTWVQSAGRPDLVLKTQIAVVGPYALAVVLLVQTYGVFGAAWAWTGRAACQAVVYFSLALSLFRVRATAPGISMASPVFSEHQGTE